MLDEGGKVVGMLSIKDLVKGVIAEKKKQLKYYLTLHLGKVVTLVQNKFVIVIDNMLSCPSSQAYYFSCKIKTRDTKLPEPLFAVEQKRKNLQKYMQPIFL